MEKVFMILGIVFVVVVIIFMIQQIIYSIQDSCEKSVIEKTRNSTNPNIYLEVAMLKDKLRCAESQLSAYKTEYAKRMQEQLNNKEKYCNEEVVQHKLWCENCKHSIRDEELMICEKKIDCKLYEKK